MIIKEFHLYPSELDYLWWPRCKYLKLLFKLLIPEWNNVLVEKTRMTTFIKTQFNISDDQRNYDNIE